ncbi:MAG: hypothetical protein VX000_00825, partial [Myxococcota bacterium]|nr:hypothetical protein [Myxococcota bacterium]
ALFVTLDDLDVSGLRVSADPEASISTAYNEWGTEDVGVPGTGVVAVSDNTNLDTVDISGFNNCGLFLQPASSGSTGTAMASGVTIENTGRFGVYSGNMESSFTDSTVSGTRLVDTDEERFDESVGQDVLCYYVNYFAGVYNAEGSVDWTGGSISDNAGWGVSSIFGAVSIDGAAIAGNHCAGILGYQGTTAVSNSTLSGQLDNSVIYSFSVTLVVLENNSFDGNRCEDGFQVVYDYMDTSGYRIVYDYAPGFANVSDILLFEVAESIVQGNTFTNGDRGLQILGGASTVSGNSWTGYRSTVVAASDYDTQADVEMSDNAIASSGGLLVDCSDASLELTDLIVSGGTHYQYSYQYTIEYSDGQTSTSTSTGTSGNIGLRGYECNLYVDTATFNDLEGNAIELLAYSDGTSTAELYDVSVLNAGLEPMYADSAITANVYGGDVSLYVDGLRITNASNDHALELFASSGTMLLDGEDILINGTAGNGLNLAASPTGTLTADVSDIDIQNATEDGIYASNASLAVTNGSVAASAASGLYVDGGDTTVTDTNFDSNAGYGMECEGDGVQVCAGVSHSTTGLGEQTGCDASCGEPVDTGGDTGAAGL